MEDIKDNRVLQVLSAACAEFNSSCGGNWCNSSSVVVTGHIKHSGLSGSLFIVVQNSWVCIIQLG